MSLADNIDALRIPIETLNREMFKNGFEVVEKWKYKCNNCSKEFQYAPTPDNPDEQPFEANGDNYTSAHPRKKKAVAVPKAAKLWYVIHVEVMTWLRPVPEHRKTLENLMNDPVNSNQQTLEDVARQLERDFEIADNAYLLLLKNYKIDDSTGDYRCTRRQL